MEKILIVDDSILQAAQLKAILADEYDVTVVQTAEEGLRYAGSGDFSLILREARSYAAANGPFWIIGEGDRNG